MFTLEGLFSDQNERASSEAAALHKGGFAVLGLPVISSGVVRDLCRLVPLYICVKCVRIGVGSSKYQLIFCYEF